jgi:hypothetical protein
MKYWKTWYYGVVQLAWKDIAGWQGGRSSAEAPVSDSLFVVRPCHWQRDTQPKGVWGPLLVEMDGF